MAEFEVGNQVKPKGKFKKVIDFLSTSDKETLKLLATFFDRGDSDPVKDARRLKKPRYVSKVYRDSVEVELKKDEFVWEEKKIYFETIYESTTVVKETNDTEKSSKSSKANTN